MAISIYGAARTYIRAHGREEESGTSGIHHARGTFSRLRSRENSAPVLLFPASLAFVSLPRARTESWPSAERGPKLKIRSTARPLLFILSLPSLFPPPPPRLPLPAAAPARLGLVFYVRPRFLPGRLTFSFEDSAHRAEIDDFPSSTSASRHPLGNTGSASPFLFFRFSISLPSVLFAFLFLLIGPARKTVRESRAPAYRWPRDRRANWQSVGSPGFSDKATRTRRGSSQGSN